jgi:alkylation response protein AidB-like acyl-CoA dehydrogenase
MLALDMRAPGIVVRPVRQLTGEHEFAEVFLTDVRVPEACAIGAVGDGWRVAMVTLLHERGTLGVALTASLQRQVGRLLELVRAARPDDPRIRERLAREWIELRALRLANERGLEPPGETGVPGPEWSLVKLRWSEANQRVTRMALDLLGPEGVRHDAGRDATGTWLRERLRSRANTIEAGTSEVLRAIVAERVLGLPRSR